MLESERESNALDFSVPLLHDSGSLQSVRCDAGHSSTDRAIHQHKLYNWQRKARTIKRLICAMVSSVAIAIFLMPVSYASDKSTVRESVTIIKRAQSQSTYKYEVPGYTAWGCGADLFGQTGCTDGVSPSLLVGEYNVSGATLSLLLPDGRVVVVNCVAKRRYLHSRRSDWRTNDFGNYRDCRQPPTDGVVVEFEGNKAKLIWPVSIDGTKMQDETYKIIAVLSKKESQ